MISRGYTVLLSTTPWTQAFRSDLPQVGGRRLLGNAISPVFDGFKDTVKGRHDFSELAIGTFLLATAAEKPLKWLPITISQRVQFPSLVHNLSRPIIDIEDLRGKTVAVRSYTQTTGIWVRKLLLERYGLHPSAVNWITFEDGHVPEIADPSNCTRADSGADMLAMLERGDVDAAIFGSARPDRDWLAPIINDLPPSETEWFARFGYVPINHLLVVRSEIAETNPQAVRSFMTQLLASYAAGPDGAPETRRKIIARQLADCARTLIDQQLLTTEPDIEVLFAQTGTC